MKKMQNLFLFVALFLMGASSAFAQPKGEAVVIGQSFTLQSDVLNEERPYMVYVPSDYDPEGQPVAVMYLMDGKGHFLHTSGVVEFLKRQNRIPRMMIVAIPNTQDRTRDLTPTIEVDEQAKKNFPTAGGANKTLSFIRDELIPHIEGNYNVNKYRVLVGHSFGGIFAVNALLTDPEVFDSYISISPSMWWDQQNLVERAETFLDTKPDLDAFFYMTMGDEGGSMLGGAMKLAALFEEKSPENFGWDFKVMKEETHGSIPHRSTYYGLEAIFKDWFRVDLAKLYAESGFKGIDAHYEKMTDKLGFAMAPTELAINNLGYRYMGQKNYEEAIKVFAENVKRFPKSFNVFDSLAEGYMEQGDKEKAIKHYKKSVALNPANANGFKMLNKLGVEYSLDDLIVKIPTTELQGFAGNYQLQSGDKITMEMEGDQLVVLASGQIPKLHLHSVGNDRFVAKPLDFLLTFELTEENKIKGFEAMMGIGQVVQGKRLE